MTNELKMDASRNAVFPEGVSQVVISEGKFLAQVVPEFLGDDLSLSLGADLIPLEPVETGSVAGPADYRPALRGAVLAPDAQGRPIEELCLASVNGIPDWALPGRQTIQLQFVDFVRSCQVQLAAPIHIPAHSRPLAFRAYLASHRAVAGLELVRVKRSDDGTEKVLHSARLTFDETRAGGQQESEYAAVEQELAPCGEDTDLYLSFRFEAYRGSEGGDPPFLFIAEPRVQELSEDPDALEAFVLRSSFPAGHDAIWLGAPLPQIAQPTALELVTGDRSYTLLDDSSAGPVELAEDHGHSLKLTTAHTGSYRVLLDGTFHGYATISPDGYWLRMPQDYQTGHYHKLEVKDRAGVRTVLSTYILTPRLLTPMHVLQTESRAPFPGPLMPQADHRYGALKAQLAAGIAPEDQAQLAYALQVVEGGHDNVKLKPLHFPQVDAPTASIVIPAHNKVEVTYLALASLLLAHNKASFEVIVVDDASTDETAELEDIVSGITVIHNAQAQRFIRACNAGADQARGDYVVLLNNDVEVTNGWLDALIDAFDRFDNVGLVGSKLLYPDGRLQDAGGMIWGSGNPWGYGNLQNPWDPRFSYARQADYLCGASMMTTKKIWDELGGLSNYLEPMYFEDTDFAFKVREAGYTTWFVPSSVVYHYEGMTSGTDTSTGFKRYQEVNRPKFKRRWAAAYAGHGAEGVNPDLEKDRGIVGRVLFIDHSVPRADRDAGSHAAIQEIRLVQSLGYKVTFLPSNLAHLGAYTEELEKMGVEVIYAPFVLSVNEYLDAHAAEFDAFFITRFYVAQDVIDRLRTLAPEARILFNNADLHFLRELRAGAAANDDAMIAKAHETRDQEIAVMRKSDVVLSYNDVEHSVIQSHMDGRVNVAKCPWVVDMPDTVPAAIDTRAHLSFLGNYQHAPNAEGVLWFAREVMPLLETEAPDLEFFIYGSAMTDEIKALEDDRTHAQGFVEVIADAYDKHRIFIAPLLSGAGIKGKVLAALAHGVPCVLTPTAAEGIGLRHGLDCMIAQTPEEWVAAITSLQTDDALWQKISENARDYVRQSFSFETGRDLMRAAFESVDLYSPVA
jgi:GT2 family glycosyltransferase